MKKVILNKEKVKKLSNEQMKSLFGGETSTTAAGTYTITPTPKPPVAG